MGPHRDQAYKPLVGQNWTPIVGQFWMPIDNVRKTAVTQIVRPRQTNFSGSHSSPIAIRDVSAVSVRGLMGSLMKRSDIIGILAR